VAAVANTRVEDIKQGLKDLSGNDIVNVYALSPPAYAVYRNTARVMIQFADDRKRANRQRNALAQLSPLRGQISGLIDGWHSSENPVDNSRAARYDKRVADAVVTGLEGNMAGALALLTEIRNDVVAERKSLAQTDYLAVAAGVGIALIIFLGLISAHWFETIRIFPRSATAVWTGASGGTLGAFFSIAIALRNRTILVDLQQWDNRRDAILRIAVGTIGGAILICLFLTGLVTTLSIGKAELTPGVGPYADLLALVIGFIAGFSERAVPDLLAKANLATDPDTDGTASDVAGDQAKAATAPVKPAVEGLGDEGEDGNGGTAPHPEEGEDACLSDSPPVPGEELTEDKDLPVAVGGVSADVVAAPPGAGDEPPAPSSGTKDETR
jgi:hypothetical protein